MAPDPCLLEIHPAGLYFTLRCQSWHPPIPPSLPQWTRPRPLPIHSAPTDWPVLSTEARPAVEASPVAIGTMATVNRLEHDCSSVSAIWTTHRTCLLLPGRCFHTQRRELPQPNHQLCVGEK